MEKVKLIKLTKKQKTTVFERKKKIKMAEKIDMVEIDIMVVIDCILTQRIIGMWNCFSTTLCLKLLL